AIAQHNLSGSCLNGLHTDSDSLNGACHAILKSVDRVRQRANLVLGKRCDALSEITCGDLGQTLIEFANRPEHTMSEHGKQEKPYGHREDKQNGQQIGRPRPISVETVNICRDSWYRGQRKASLFLPVPPNSDPCNREKTKQRH